MGGRISKEGENLVLTDSFFQTVSIEFVGEGGGGIQKKENLVLSNLFLLLKSGFL